MAVKLIDELQKEIKAAGEAVTQEAYEKAYDLSLIHISEPTRH